LQHPPVDARVRETHGVSIATFPSSVGSNYTGCQRTWFGDHRELGGMQLLMTTYFDTGRAVRLTGGEPPAGPVYDCRYVDGDLHRASSVNSRPCPERASDLERASK